MRESGGVLPVRGAPLVRATRPVFVPFAFQNTEVLGRLLDPAKRRDPIPRHKSSRVNTQGR